MEEIKQIIAEHINIDVIEIKDSDNLITDLQMNSFDLITMVCELEERFNIEVSEQEIRNIKTVQDIYEFIKVKK